MSVDFGWRTVGGPPGMTDTDIALEAGFFEMASEIGYDADSFGDFETTIGYGCQPRAVISSVLQTLQAVK